MRPKTLLVSACLGAAAVLSAGAAFVQDGDRKPFLEMTPQEQAAVMAKAMELGQPSKEHELLARYAGEFEQDLKLWMDPAGEPIASKSESTNEMILGGRFLRAHSKGSMMGMATESISVLGFDRRHEVFTTVGYDTMGTYWVTAQGPWDEASRSMTMYGEDEDPVMGVTQKYDFVMTLIDDDTYKFEVIFKPGVFGNDEPYKMVEILSRRKK